MKYFNCHSSFIKKTWVLKAPYNSFFSNILNSTWPSIFTLLAIYVASGERKVSPNGNCRVRHHCSYSLMERSQTNLFSSPWDSWKGMELSVWPLLVTKTEARRTKGDPSRKTRKRTRRSIGLSILFPEFPFGSLREREREILTARRKPIRWPSAELIAGILIART